MQGKNLTVVLVIVVLLALGLVTYWFVKRGQVAPSPTVPSPAPTAPVPGPEVPPPATP